jgi:Phospholipid methyltransferase
MRNATADRANVIASPTVIFAGVLVLGFGLDMARCIRAGKLGLAAGTYRDFDRRQHQALRGAGNGPVKTNLNIRKPTNDIVTSGPYSVSRNPLYIGMILLNIGIGCIVNSLWIFLLSAGLAAALRKGVIEPEETYLEKKFGDKYLRYKARVRRWF